MFQYFIEIRLKNNFKPGEKVVSTDDILVQCQETNSWLCFTGLFEQRVMGDLANSNYGAHLPFKSSKFHKNNRTFGITWLKDAFVTKS